MSDLATVLATMHRVATLVPTLDRPVDFSGRAGVAMSREDWVAARESVRNLMPGLQAFLRSTEAADGPGPSRP